MSAFTTSSNVPQQRLRIGDWVADQGANLLAGPSGIARIPPKAMAVLAFLASNAGETVPRQALLDAVWPESFPTPDVASQAIRELRRAFGDDALRPRYILTVPKVGYRLIAPVQIEGASEKPIPPASIGSAPLAGITRKQWQVVAGALATVGMMIAIVHSRPGAVLLEGSQATPPIEHVTYTRGREGLPAISPDGKYIAYTAWTHEGAQVRVKSLSDSGSALSIPTPNRMESLHPVWSDRGAALQFLLLDRDTCTYGRFDLVTDETSSFGTCSRSHFQYFDVRPEGGWITSITDTESGGVALTEYVEGRPVPVAYSRSPGDEDYHPRYSPDGSRIVFRRGALAMSQLLIVDRDSGATRPITTAGMHIMGFDFLSDSRTVVLAAEREGVLELLLADSRGGALRRTGLRDVRWPDAASGSAKIALEVVQKRTALFELKMDAQRWDEAVRLTESSGSDFGPAIAPESGALAFLSTRTGSKGVWLISPGEAEARQLQVPPGMDVMALGWDRGSLLAFARSERPVILLLDTSGAAAKQLTALEDRALPLRGSDGAGFMVWLQSSRKALRVRADGSTAEESGHPLGAAAPKVGSARTAPVLQWVRQGGRAWYLSLDESGVHVRERLGGSDRRLPPNVPVSVTGYSQIAVDANRGRIIVAADDRDETDIGIVDGSRWLNSYAGEKKQLRQIAPAILEPSSR